MRRQSRLILMLTITLMLFSILPSMAAAKASLAEAGQVKLEKCHNCKCPHGNTCME